MTGKATVFIVDDEPASLQGLSWLLQQASFSTRAFGSGREFLAAYRPEEPGCLLLDLRMPEMDGLEVQRRLRERGIGLPVIFMTAYGDIPACTEAFKAGALDFLEKPLDGRNLVHLVRQAVARDLEQKRHGSAAEFAARRKRLTPREKAVMEMLISGKSLKEIAAVSNVTVQTIWRHRVGIFKKMGVANESALVRTATQWAHRAQ